MIVHKCEQLSDEWFQLRKGTPTASQFGRILSTGGPVWSCMTSDGQTCGTRHRDKDAADRCATKLNKKTKFGDSLYVVTELASELSEAANEYICELVAERLCLIAPVEKTLNGAMRHGVEFEPEARRWFEFDAGVDVEQVGFITTDDGRFGCSPDGLVGECCGLELKCPQGKTHVGYLMNGGLPDEYKAQVHGSMIVTGRTSWWFLSYCPGLPPLKLLVLRDEYTDKLAAALELFHERYAEALARFSKGAA